MLEYSFDRRAPVAALQQLLSQTTWANNRKDGDVALILASTPIQLSVWKAGRLVGYARAITDGRFRALIDDVVVDEGQRGYGIGREIMRRLVDRLADVDEIFLLCDDCNAVYYERLGFEPVMANCLWWPPVRRAR